MSIAAVVSHRLVQVTGTMVILLAVSAQAQTGGSSTEFTGCYAVDVGSWTPRIDPAPFHAIPARIRLDTTMVDGHVIRRLTPAMHYRYPSSFAPSWQVHGDTLVLMWSNGFAPTIVSVQSRDSLLVGVAEARSDAIRPRWPRAPVTLRRSTCNASDSSSRHQPNVL